MTNFAFGTNNEVMKKVYVITIFSICAIIGLQIVYISQVYTNYADTIKSEADKSIKEALSDELHLRSHHSMSYQSLRNYHIQSLDEMTSRERDSLMKICPPDKEDNVINMDSIRQKRIGVSGEDLMEQVIQDRLFLEHNYLNLKIFYTLFKSKFKRNLKFRFLLMDKHKTVTDSIGVNTLTFLHKTNIYPIGTKGQLYLQAEISVPLSYFMIRQTGIILSSLFFVLIALYGLAFQLVEIRRKNENLAKRTQTVNGRIHDLKTPLNSTLMVLNRLEKMVQNKRMKQRIQINAGIVRRMIWHIEELLQVARKVPTQLILNKTFIQVPQMAEALKNELDILYQNKPHTIIIHNELPATIQVKADNLYLENAICNLVENSLKYSDNGVKVDIYLQTCGNNLKVSVKDNGWGIPHKFRKLVFENFFRIRYQDKNEVQGYGIGLGRVRSIILAHNGTIDLVSPKEGGSLFSFQIPLI